MGFDAVGQIAKSVVFGKWRGVRYARRYVKPANPQTAAQTTTRVVFATLREMWKISPNGVRAPWDAFAAGRPFLGLNAFVGENMRVVRGDALFTDFLGSPGAKGGLPAASVVAAGGSLSGEIDLTFTLPTVPSGWTHVACHAMAFPDQDPETDFGGPMIYGTVSAPTLVVTLAGLGSGVSCVNAGWLEWTKPNGETAYSVGVTDTTSATA
jgi:hypothetical protein